MAGEFEGDGAGEEGRVHEEAFSERHRVGDGARLIEPKNARDVGGKGGFAGKSDLDVGNADRRLINDKGGSGRLVISECDLPRPLASAAMFDGMVEDGVTRKSQEKGQSGVFQEAVGFHARIQAWREKERVSREACEKGAGRAKPELPSIAGTLHRFAI